MRAIIARCLVFLVLLGLGGCSYQCGKSYSTGSETEKSWSSGPTEKPASPAAESQPAPPSAGGPQVVSLAIGDAYDAKSGKITHEAEAFTPATPAIHIAAELAGLKKGEDMKGVLMAIAVTTKSGQKVANTEVASAHMAAPGVDSDVHFKFTAPTKGWPQGSYQLTLFVDNQPIHAKNLTVR